MAKIDNPYYDDKGVPYNLLGITDAKSLKRLEYVVTHTRAKELQEKPVLGNYDLEHLKKIHQYLFQDIYGWAGKIRTINFSKLDVAELQWKTVFAPTHSIPEVSQIAQKDIQDLLTLGKANVINKEEFADLMTDAFHKLNYMHPFPEGNGRSTRIMMMQFSREAGFLLDFEKVDENEWNHAAARHLPQINVIDGAKRKGDRTLMREVFLTISAPIQNRVSETPVLTEGTSELLAAQGLEREQQAAVEGASVEQAYQETLANYVLAKHEQAGRVEARIEGLIERQEARLQQTMSAKPGMLALSATRRAWQQKEAQQQARLHSLHQRLDAVREIKEGMGVFAPRIEEMATRRMRTEHPELASDWDAMREAGRRHQEHLRKQEKEKKQKQYQEKGKKLSLFHIHD